MDVEEEEVWLWFVDEDPLEDAEEDVTRLIGKEALVDRMVAERRDPRTVRVGDDNDDDEDEEEVVTDLRVVSFIEDIEKVGFLNLLFPLEELDGKGKALGDFIFKIVQEGWGREEGTEVEGIEVEGTEVEGIETEWKPSSAASERLQTAKEFSRREELEKWGLERRDTKGFLMKDGGLKWDAGGVIWRRISFSGGKKRGNTEIWTSRRRRRPSYCT